MGDLLTYLPTIATALANPVAGIAELAAGFIGKKLGLSDTTVEGVKSAFAGMKPEDLLKQKQLDVELQEHLADNGIKLAVAQIETNTEEAKSSFLFVAGWRPYIGWICGTGLGYEVLLRPILNGIVSMFTTAHTGVFPAVEIQDLLALVSTMLGQSWLRSQDKKNGNSNGV